jgi:hypothetical protein
MTPTLLGRWQTRIAMLGTLGLLITAIFAWVEDSRIFFYVLGYVALFGIGWDIGYMLLQQLRWDRDWPPVFQWAAGAWEGAFLYVILDRFGLPGIGEGIVPLRLFVLHYGSVFLVTWLWVQGPMRALFPRWRFHGGRIV